MLLLEGTLLGDGIIILAAVVLKQKTSPKAKPSD